MKKIIGILGIAVVAVVLFTNTNTVSNSTDMDLASLMELNTANAECPKVPYWLDGRCSFTGNCWWIGVNEPGVDCTAN